MPFRKLFALVERPYRLLLKDVITIYMLLSHKLRRAIILLIVLMFCQATAELLMIMSIRHLGLAPSNPSALAAEFPYFLMFSFSPALKEWASQAPERYLLLAAAMVAFFVCLKNTITYFTMRNTSRTSENVSLSIGTEMMERYLYSDYRWHLSKASGQALQMLLWRGTLATLLVQQLSAITGFITCTVLFIGMIVQEPYLSFTIMTTMVGIGILLYARMRRGIDRNAAHQASAAVAENKVIMAATRGIRDVLIYGQQPAFDKSFASTIIDGIKPKIFLLVANAIPTLVLETMGFLLIPVTVLLLMLRQAAMPEIISAVMLLVLTAWRVLPYLNRGVGQMVAIRSIRPMALPVLDFLQTLRKNRQLLPPPPKTDFSFTSGIELVDAGFSYPDTQAQSLNNVNLAIPKGKLIGFIGPSGAGKSTTCNLLSGLCKPTSGKFLVDGRELDEAELAAFKKRIGFVPQAPFLMGGTLADNVAFSQWGKPWEAEKVIRACKLAAIDFVPLDENGVLYPIGENGAGLSGGQAQRVSIARALYAEPELIIFDEATSALDTGNENMIVSAIEKLRGNVTCIIIAHRLSTVEHCDLIYWFDNGSIVKCGPPQEILPQYMATFHPGGEEG